MNPYNVLIVSDLHLSQGRDPKTGQVSRTEDFFFDEEFAAFLQYHQNPREWKGRRWKLVINGDFLDFLQVASHPESDSDCVLQSLRRDPKYGLKTGPAESAWKLRQIVRGHWQFFDALAEFAVDNEVVFVSGNHDIEFYYPQVQEALVDELASRIDSSDEAMLRSHLTFLPWFYLEEDLYVEHGHQYDALNSFTHILDPRLPNLPCLESAEEDDIDLPMGSLFVRYLFNQVEISTPFADNIKPPTRFLSWFFLNHPFQAFRFLLTDGREMLRRLKRKWRPLPESTFSGRESSHREALQVMARQIAESRRDHDEEYWRDCLEQLDRMRVASIMRQSAGVKWVVGKMLVGPLRTPLLLISGVFIFAAGIAVMLAPLLVQIVPSWIRLQAELVQDPLRANFSWAIETIRWLFMIEVMAIASHLLIKRVSRDSAALVESLHEKAAEIHQLLKVKYVVMGHTHQADLWNLMPGLHYFNTGTWTKVFSQEERVLREEREFTFVQVVRTEAGTDASLMKWEGKAKAARLAYLFSGCTD